jgi:hypothetical protein
VGNALKGPELDTQGVKLNRNARIQDQLEKMYTKTDESDLNERDWKLGLGGSRKTLMAEVHFEMSHKFNLRNSICGQLSLRLLNCHDSECDTVTVTHSDNGLKVESS